MQGVYLAAAQLSKLGFVVSPTARNAFGADLLVTDCDRSWSVQVKTNRGRPKFWLVNKSCKTYKSRQHVYVFVNLGQDNPRQEKLPPDFYVVPSHIVAKHMIGLDVAPTIHLNQIGKKYKDAWTFFGSPSAS
jgi:hypothetical protein